MSSKTNKSINSALGVLGDVVVVDISNTAVASGLLQGDQVYRLDCDVDISLEITSTNDGVCNTTVNPTLFGGVPEVFSTPADVTSSPGDNTVHILASGISAAGTLHCTRMKTRGE